MFVLAISLSFYFVVFDQFQPPQEPFVSSQAVAIVFTGQYSRLDAALELLASNAVQKVYISGVNAGAGLDPRTFPSFLKDRNRRIENLMSLLDCCVTYNSAAQDTYQNAADAKCWLDVVMPKGPVFLVTSSLHMARAIFLLRVKLPLYDVVPYPVQSSSDFLSEARRREFAKLLFVILAEAFPRFMAGKESHSFVCTPFQSLEVLNPALPP